MFVTRFGVSLTTDSASAATSYTSEPVNGRVLQIRYVPDGSTPLDTSADVDITGEVTGVVIANLVNIGTSAFTRAIRQPVHAPNGAIGLYAAAGATVQDHVVLAGERIQVAVASGGATKLGTFHIWVG